MVSLRSFLLLRVSLSIKPRFPQYTHGADRVRMKLLSPIWFAATMKTKSGNYLAAFIIALLALLNPFATAAQPLGAPEIRAAAANATTQSDHEDVAKHYEDAAAQIQAKVTEKKELLEHYEDKSYLYGRRAQDLQSHTHASIRNYEKAVAENMRAAAFHRQIASKLNENHAASASRTPDAVSGL